MKNSIKYFFLFAIQILNAQIGIGTQDPNSTSLLDIKSITLGVLIPRMDTASELAIAFPATGLIIYNTQTSQVETNVGTPQAPNWRGVLGETGSSGPSGVVSFGTVNVPTADGALALGGSGNVASGVYSSTMGGSFNQAEGARANAHGGGSNTATGTGSNTIGGFNNHAIGADSNAFGGTNNIVNGVGANALGGSTNNVVGTGASCLGGVSNIAGAPSSSIIGGTNNNASEDSSAVAGGINNYTSGTNAIILAGSYNNASANETGVLGGNLNSASGVSAAIAGGVNNKATAGSAGVVGGELNSATAVGAVVIGGNNNTSTATSSSVTGGKLNSSSGVFATISGGIGNYAKSYAEWVGGIYSPNISPGSASSSIATDRLFTIGNGTETVPSNAFIIFKNGLALLPSVTNGLITNGNERTIITKEFADEKYGIKVTTIPPASTSDTGTVGEIRVTATHIYTCIATNSWVSKAATPW